VPRAFTARATEVSSLNVKHLSRAHLTVEPFQLADGECMVVSGPSGASKSLLLRAIADLDPNDGEILLDDESREARPETASAISAALVVIRSPSPFGRAAPARRAAPYRTTPRAGFDHAGRCPS
jgi:ABC-type cobalamin/Fe3+-siderophores transport system ATPase subunit